VVGSTHNEQAGRDYELIISIGLSHLEPDNPCSIDELMTIADKMMYEDKRRHQEERNGKKEEL
jgi:PleD family two-component response regulator